MSGPEDRHPDHGSGVVLVLGLAAVTLGLGLAVTAAGAAAVARQRAAAVADLAALAAAGDPVAVCERAAVVAAVSGAALVSCRALPDGSVVVGVVGSLPPWLDRFAAGRRPTGWARAGPPGSP